MAIPFRKRVCPMPSHAGMARTTIRLYPARTRKLCDAREKRGALFSGANWRRDEAKLPITSLIWKTGCNALMRAVPSHFLHARRRRFPAQFGRYLSWGYWSRWAGASTTLSLHNLWLQGLHPRAEFAWEGERLKAWIASVTISLLGKKTEYLSFREKHLSDLPKYLKHFSPGGYVQSHATERGQAFAFHTYPCLVLSVNWGHLCFFLALHGLQIIWLSDYLIWQKYYFSLSLLCSKEIKITLASYQYTCESTKIKQRQNTSWNSFPRKMVSLLVQDMVSDSYLRMLLLVRY